jgi:7-cyano-7-deazaguanine synthase
MTLVKPGASKPTVAVLLSGGLDSAILLADLLGQGRRVQPIYVRCHLVWEKAELRAVGRLLKALTPRWPGLLPLVTLDLPVADLYENHWSLTGRDPPDAASPDDAVYLPGRNALLLVKAGLWCQLHGVEELALGVLGSNPFADATPAFFDEFQSALNRATGGRLRILRPFAGLDKRQVLQRAVDLPLQLTFSCIAPVRGLPCGRCNKCAERQAAIEGKG